MIDIKSMNALNVTFLIPFPGNRFLPSAARTPTIHILAMEEAGGSRAQCGLRVQSGRHSWSQRTRLKAFEVSLVHPECLEAVTR